jgi:hypothetical protein
MHLDFEAGAAPHLGKAGEQITPVGPSTINQFFATASNKQKFHHILTLRFQTGSFVRKCKYPRERHAQLQTRRKDIDRVSAYAFL